MLLLLPVNKKIDWKRAPVVTLLLVLINCVVYFGFQTRDNERVIEAYKYYHKSRLPAVEFPAYLRYLENGGDITHAAEFSQMVDAGDPGFFAAVRTLQADGAFLARLRAGEVITSSHPDFSYWQHERVRFDELLGRSIADRYGFTPRLHEPVTAFTHMFLHGSVMHLVGNMVFLFLIGFMIEGAIGSAAYLGAYLLGGLGAVGLFWALNPEMSGPLVGASGAIAGLMGMYTVLFGLRRIRFFYWFLFYFGFMRAPAFVLLPLWVGNEIYQLLSNDGSNVAYEAHIGGLLSGALIAGLLKAFWSGVDALYLDEEQQSEQRVEEYDIAMRHLAALEIEPARQAFERLLAAAPQDRGLRTQLYNIAKFQPDSEDYHRRARELFSLPGSDKDTLRFVRDKFVDYMENARPAMRLAPPEYLGIVQRLAAGGYSADAEKVVMLLLKTQADHPVLPRALLGLVEGFRRERATDKAREYQSTLIGRFPRSPEAAEARALKG